MPTKYHCQYMTASGSPLHPWKPCTETFTNKQKYTVHVNGGHKRYNDPTIEKARKDPVLTSMVADWNAPVRSHSASSTVELRQTSAPSSLNSGQMPLSGASYAPHLTQTPRNSPPPPNYPFNQTGPSSTMSRLNRASGAKTPPRRAVTWQPVVTGYDPRWDFEMGANASNLVPAGQGPSQFVLPMHPSSQVQHFKRTSG